MRIEGRYAQMASGACEALGKPSNVGEPASLVFFQNQDDSVTKQRQITQPLHLF